MAVQLLARWFAIAIALTFVAINGVRLSHRGHIDASPVRGSQTKEPSTKPIEQLRVGERVIAQQQTDLSGAHEPVWATWLRLEAILELQSSDNSASRSYVTIELLRPESWVRRNVQLVSSNSVKSLDTLSFHANPHTLSPIRGIYLDILNEINTCESLQQSFDSLLVHLDLPEMGAVGDARITAIENAPAISTGAGSVITATFAHPAEATIYDAQFSCENTARRETIGVTENHPFWSADRAAFLPLKELQIGERLLSYRGEPIRLANRIARSSSEQVYNIEVYGRHVYYVGESNILVHNNCLNDDWENNPRDRPTYSYEDARDAGLKPVSNRSALMSGRPLSVVEDHHIASPYQKGLKALFDKFGLDIKTHEPNLLPLNFHTGPHLDKYHDFVSRVLSRAIGSKDGTDAIGAINAALGKLGRFLQKHPAIPNHFRL